jgi:hypothetical protein
VYTVLIRELENPESETLVLKSGHFLGVLT